MSPHSTVSTFEGSSAKTLGQRKDSNASSMILIRNLAKALDSNALKSMLVFAKDLINVDFVPNPADDGDFKTAVARFSTSAASQEAKSMLDGKWNSSGDAHLIVSYIPVSPGGSSGLRRALEAAAVSSPDGLGSVRSSSSKFNGQFSPFDQVGSPTMSTSPFTSSNDGMPRSDSFTSMFPPQGPLGSPLERQRVSGKSVINEDGADDETGKLINDPVAFAKNDMTNGHQPRRSTMPQLPVTRLSGLSINTPTASPNINGAFSPRTLQSPTTFSHQAVQAPNNGFTNNLHYPRNNMPPVNPADQNPPCNTLYVGNLPQDTAEDELKLLFSKQRGYKRLCFRVKQQGPMCFVEFEDVSFATKALHELYGHMLSNSVKGGIRLSFSKNPLGVRQNQQNGLVSPLSPPGSGNGMTYGNMTAFSAASGPPPGLSMPSPYGVMSPVVQNNAFGGLSPVSSPGMTNHIHGPGSPPITADLSARSSNAMSANTWASINNNNYQYGRPLYG
ncbi:MAG: hypothetical protein GOMPHAMPRED_002426 [Gomphillus americanus]|uniref:RRM domain-containing protein n=1 Tax=Gomphillus americanus TaxID=1940652 RepID=A0A8H3IBE1_9LECA|nr:MAG: hypothetical protein GOMPHAMPRED_002426 [Gomphillus americanus]